MNLGDSVNILHLTIENFFLANMVENMLMDKKYVVYPHFATMVT